MKIEQDVPVEMRDGVVLSCDVYVPDGDGPHPVLVSRTPYSKETSTPTDGRTTCAMAYEYVIDLTPIAIVFQPGHRFRLDIASSDFPNCDRNHNTGADFWSDSDLRVANQTVFHDDDHPSRLVLPVIDS